MTDSELALAYAPILHMDAAETIPLRAVGYTIFRTAAQSASFPKRRIEPEPGGLIIEYAFYFDYDVEHMYDLEHIWVFLGPDGNLRDAQGSYHGKYLNLLLPDFPGALSPDNGHVQAFCQPGKHAFLASGDMTRLYPGWDRCCTQAGGPVLIGNPFEAAWSPSGKDLFVPTDRDNQNSIRWLREHLSFTPSLRFLRQPPVPADLFLPWPTLFEKIPVWIARECQRLSELYAKEE